MYEIHNVRWHNFHSMKQFLFYAMSASYRIIMFTDHYFASPLNKGMSVIILPYSLALFEQYTLDQQQTAQKLCTTS